MHGNAGWYGSVRRLTSYVAVFVPGQHLTTGLRRGASESNSNEDCLSPVGAHRWYALALPDPETAAEFELGIWSFGTSRPWLTRPGPRSLNSSETDAYVEPLDQ